MHVLEAFHGRISVLIEMYDENESISKKSLQKSIDRELDRLKVLNNDEIPDGIKRMLKEKGLKY